MLEEKDKKNNEEEEEEEEEEKKEEEKKIIEPIETEKINPEINNNNLIANKIIEEYQELIEEISKIKETGNKCFNQKDYDESEKNYRLGIDKIEKFSPSKSLSEFNEEVQDYIFKVNSYKKVLYGNLSVTLAKKKNYKDAIQICLYILNNIDPEDESSYIRLLKWYIEDGDFEKAKKIAEEIKEKFRKLKMIIMNS